MVDVKKVYDALLAEGINFYTGVPDSLLKNFCAYIMDNVPRERNIIAANEGAAVGIAAGYYMGTGNIPVVYMQNSGIGNAVNPLLSLMDEKVYNLPVLLFIGWRGEPGEKDEPQHIKQGEVTEALLEAMQISYDILEPEEEVALCQIEKIIQDIKKTGSSRALIIRRNILGDYKLQNKAINPYVLSREEALKVIIDQLGENDVVVSTTGKLSRELFEYRESLRQGHECDFLTVGSMGHSCSIALGIALVVPGRNVYCLDGDGAFIMHMGAISNIGDLAPENYHHIIFNNGAHESVGAQPTVAFGLDIPAIFKSCGYKAAFLAENIEDIKIALREMQLVTGPTLLEIRVGINSRENLGRPTTTPGENKKCFMNYLKEKHGS